MGIVSGGWIHPLFPPLIKDPGVLLMPRVFFAVAAILPVFLFISDVFGSENTKPDQTIKLKHDNDIVTMQNGDRNTGEIKKLEFGILYLKSDLVADTLKLDWEKVVEVRSIAHYEFETKDREYYYGVITSQTIPPKGTLRVRLDRGDEIDLEIRNIISIREIGRSFLSRMNISIDAGAGYTSANNRKQSNVNIGVLLQYPKYSGNLDLSSQFSGEPGTEKTSRHELQLTARRFIRKKWDWLFLAAFLHDKQQELNLRSTFGGGVERNLYKSNRTFLSVTGGIVFTDEDYLVEDREDRKNAEALGALTLSTYRFRGSSLETHVLVFPSLSDPGRIRIDTDFDWKWDMVMDFYWKIGLTNNYDNQPPPGGINNNLSVTTTIGWTF